MVGLMSGKAKSEPIGSSGTAFSSNITSITMPPQRITFSFDYYESFTFNRKGKSVTLSGDEIFDALNESH